MRSLCRLLQINIVIAELPKEGSGGSCDVDRERPGLLGTPGLASLRRGPLGWRPLFFILACRSKETAPALGERPGAVLVRGFHMPGRLGTMDAINAPSNYGLPLPVWADIWFARYSQGGTDHVCCRDTEICPDYETDSAAIVASFGALDLVLFWSFCFIMAEALKTATRRGEIETATPVLGFRPMRWPFLRTVNVPNDDNFTVSPCAMVSVISFKTRSTRADDSFRVSPTFVR
jgi:hypothetical protein